MLIPQTDKATEAVGESVENMVSTVTQAYFTSSAASLEVQRSTTGSYSGASLQPPMTLMRGDASSYCIQFDRPPLLQHMDGPGGVPAPGPCA